MIHFDILVVHFGGESKTPLRQNRFRKKNKFNFVFQRQQLGTHNKYFLTVFVFP